jgi:plasmid stabilization system protein ParE
VPTADRIGDDLIAAFERLAAMPGVGHTRPDVPDPDLRFWRVHRWMIAYLGDTQPLQIARVVGGQRDFRRLFGR